MRVWSNSKKWNDFCLGDRPGRTTVGGVRSDHIMAYIDSDWAGNREKTGVQLSEGMLVHKWRTPEILVKKTESGVACAVGKCAVRFGEYKHSDPKAGSDDIGSNTRVTIACDNQGVVDH